MPVERFDLMKLAGNRAWTNKGQAGAIDPVAIALHEGGLRLAAGFGHLFWPDFIEVRGCIVRKGAYDPNAFDEWWERLKGSASEVEKVVNHLDMVDLFYMAGDAEGTSEKLTEDVVTALQMELAQILARTWSAALKDSFPSRTFKVDLFLGDEVDGPILTFYSQS
jgi:hypothetical protein